jgi:glutamate--cysteine ligase
VRPVRTPPGERRPRNVTTVGRCGSRNGADRPDEGVASPGVERTGTSPAPDAGPSVLRDCADAHAYVASICFKHGPPLRTGVELEWLLHPAPGPAALVRALGPHAPVSLDPASPALPLPAGSLVTVEPGGQVELASPPLRSLDGLLAAVRADAAALHERLRAAGLAPRPAATEPERPPVRILELPRYRAMERAFDRYGPDGRAAMCSTAAVQVSVDAGAGAEVGHRWAAVHAFGPPLLAAFANSPRLRGRDTGWKSTRWALWSAADPARTAAPPRAAVEGPDPAGAWADRVLAGPLLCVRGAREWAVPDGLTFADWLRGALPAPPTTADLDYHLSTLFPPVRPRGHLEVRYVDAQPGRRWALPVAVLTALLDPAVRDRAREAAEPAQERWTAAARDGLGDPVLGRAAAALFDLARERLPALGAPDWVLADLATAAAEVHRGVCPADRPEVAA